MLGPIVAHSSALRPTCPRTMHQISCVTPRGAQTGSTPRLAVTGKGNAKATHALQGISQKSMQRASSALPPRAATKTGAPAVTARGIAARTHVPVGTCSEKMPRTSSVPHQTVAGRRRCTGVVLKKAVASSSALTTTRRTPVAFRGTSA